MGRPKKYKDDGERRRERARREKERRAQESLEQREDRLRKMSQYVKMKRAAETEEQRLERLRKMSQNERDRRAAESKEQRLERLWRMSQNIRDRRAAESKGEHSRKPKRKVATRKQKLLLEIEPESSSSSSHDCISKINTFSFFVDKCSSQQKLQRTQDVSKMILLSTGRVQEDFLSVRHGTQLKDRNENLNFETRRTKLKLIGSPKRQEEKPEEYKYHSICKEVTSGPFTYSKNTCKPLHTDDSSVSHLTPEVPVIQVKYSFGTEVEEVITTPDIDALLDLWKNSPEPRPQPIIKRKFKGAKAVKVTVADACPAYYFWERLRGILHDKDVNFWVLKKVGLSSIKIVKLICKACNLQVWVDYETTVCIKRQPESRNPTAIDLENLLLNVAYTKYKRKVLTSRQSTDHSPQPLAM
ncbi:uncharacterized protein LOC106475495 isoform X2 [Limulus polyphemus]|uniref:Uncharacterized protein LOC106475495 isoform X2 n=1 Tax=Limulus polyphemus TaxID=6850 RepID=A0ABM1RV85_LIMPO|nr:uncharacterized protein LOC106475495 isoform X2 [Limulus polyphemus]